MLLTIPERVEMQSGRTEVAEGSGKHAVDVIIPGPPTSALILLDPETGEEHGAHWTVGTSSVRRETRELHPQWLPGSHGGSTADPDERDEVKLNSNVLNGTVTRSPSPPRRWGAREGRGEERGRVRVDWRVLRGSSVGLRCG